METAVAQYNFRVFAVTPCVPSNTKLEGLEVQVDFLVALRNPTIDCQSIGMTAASAFNVLNVGTKLGSPISLISVQESSVAFAI